MADEIQERPIRRDVTLREMRRADGTHYLLSAVLEADGSLTLQGSDAGPLVRDFLHCEDYEYTRRVPAEAVPWVLLQLLRERFASESAGHFETESAFAVWLAAHGIPSAFESWRWGRPE